MFIILPEYQICVKGYFRLFKDKLVKIRLFLLKYITIIKNFIYLKNIN
jgi:hypothetical protein